MGRGEKQAYFSKEKPNFTHELTAWKNGSLIFGTDEAGRGCFAGPVVVAAVSLKPASCHPLLIDSKKLNANQREEAFGWIEKNALISVSIGTISLIESLNIYQATRHCMLKALCGLYAQTNSLPALIITDAMPLTLPPYLITPLIAVPFAESVSATVAAASIVAKVTRDRLMQELHHTFPSYHFNT